ncbi:alpha-amylase [Vibrio salinus]|nr:alpha-amylase [Vibrio salinus]MCE0493126.1 alpha-amylase [Vibrio salinus]
MANNNHKADQSNDNKGTSGTNKTYQKVLDNRSEQLNPKSPKYNGKNK